MPETQVIPDEVLAAAKRVVRQRGPAALTMDVLAQETGLSRTTLYRRSGGREALLDALEAAGLAVGDRTDARMRILRAARAAFSRAGFSVATVEEIATDARVGLATLFRHFGDKENLAAAVIQETVPRRAMQQIEPTGDLRADLTGLAERMLAGLQQDTPLVRWMMIETLQGGPFLPKVRTLVPTRSLQAISRFFSACLASGQIPEGDPQMLAQAFAGLVMAFGFIGPLFSNGPVPDPPATARAITDLFLDGALALRRAR
jgi:AcrR family transcriptional regulator